ncbi:MAG TPA: efflux RND transporter periplasmic adaptor subunit [Polyangia bacterium]|nr:efflux RND transporter periplasmic adaptor subunit [Polyangia bacterium]
MLILGRSRSPGWAAWAGMLAVASLATACSGKGSNKAAVRPPPLVSVARVEARDVPVEVRAPVDLRPLIQADVGSKTLGYLDAVLVDRGDKVTRGQLLALVRPSDLPDQLAAARSTLAQAQSSTALARTNFDRAKQLAPEAVVSQQELQQAQSQFASAEAAQQAAQSQIAALAVRLGETRIASPLTGVVVQRRLDPGTLVGPPGGGAIVTVARVDTLRVFITVNERELAGVSVGKNAHVEVDALPGRTFTGKVVRLAPALDPGTRTLDAEVQLDNRAGELYPGMYGRGAIVVETHPQMAVVPVGAVVLTNRQAFAFAVDPGGDVVHRRALTLGVDGGDWFEIKAGLHAGDEVVVAGAEALADGMKVRAARGTDPFASGPLARDGATGAH